MHIRKLTIAALAVLLAAASARAQYGKYDDWDQNYTAQGLLGAVQYDNLKFDIPNSIDSKKTDLSLLPQFGGAWGTLPIGDRFQYGLECALLVAVQVDKVNYLYLGGGGAYASISTSLWLFDLAGGPYINLYLDAGRKVRLYAGTGPMMLYADYHAKRNVGETSTDEDASAFGVGAYARAGLEFRLYERGMLGFGVRGSWSSADFSDVGGRSELAGIAGFVTFTAGM